MAGANDLLTLPFAASAAVGANLFVKLTGEETVATNDSEGGWCVGVALTDISASNFQGVNEVTAGKTTGVQVAGVAWVWTNADLSGATLGDQVSSENDGSAVIADSGDVVLGFLLSKADGSGDPALVKVFLGGGFTIT